MPVSLIEGIAEFLEANSHGIYSPTVGQTKTIFAAEEPPAPDAIIAVLDLVGGRCPDTAGVGQENLVTVRVRDPSYAAGLARAHAVFLELHRSQGLLGGVLVALVEATAPLAPLGRDAAPAGGRWRFTQTFRVILRVGEDLV
jgi:hypothetical protein